MSEKGETFNEIEVLVSGFFTTHHDFQTPDGSLGEITMPAFSQRGIFCSASGDEFEMEKTTWWASSYRLLHGQTVRAESERRGLFSRDMLIHFDDEDYVLEPAGLLSQGWYLTDVQGTHLLEIQPRGIFRQGAYLMLFSPLEADLLVFAYYLVVMRQHEDAAAVAATSAAAAS